VGRRSGWGPHPLIVSPYLPALLRTGVEPGTWSLSGTFLSADLSGFTRLSERLADTGRLGAEVLSGAIDDCFTALIDPLAAMGGDVLFFGGDALFVAFTGAGHAGRAVEAATTMQRVLRQVGRITTPAGNIRLTMSVGVASGTAQVVVGDGPQRPLFLVGPAVTRTVELEGRASAGEVLVAPATARSLTEWELTDVDGATLVAGPRRGRAVDPAAAIATPAAIPTKADTATGDDPALHLPQALRARLVTGDAPREHRQMVVAFVRIGGLDRLAPSVRDDRLRQASETIGTACVELDVCWVSTDVIAGGAKALLVAGVPHQTDDDELRLVATARRLLASQVGPHLSIGVHRGSAFVGDIGHPSRRTYTVMGDTVNTAARLMGQARAGELLASEEVVERLDGRYDLGPEQRLSMKGKKAPVHARVVGASAVKRDRRTNPTLVGRSRELTVLRHARAAQAEGRGEVVEIVAAPGMGKSHLVASFTADIPPPDLAVSGEIGQSVVPFAAVAQPLRTLVGLDTDLSVAADQLAELAGALAPLAAPAFGLELEPTDASAAIEPRSVPEHRLDVILRLVTTAHPDPGFLLVEDTHWVDPASAVILGGLAGRLAERGWLVVSTCRPEGPFLGTRATTVTLDPLDDADLRRLAISTAGERPLSDVTLEALVDRADGNALFLSQLVEAAAAGADAHLPESAERVIGARVDVLPAIARRRLRQASVLGSEVDLELLARLTGDADLRENEAWAELDDFASAGGGWLRFRHDLFHLAAYEGLTFADRSALHAAAAVELERHADTPAAVLAQHFDRGQRPDRAAVWAARAAREATDQAAFTDAARLWTLAVDNNRRAGWPDAERATLQVELGHSYEMLAEPSQAERAFKQALGLAPVADRSAIRVRLAWLAFRNDRITLAKRRVTVALNELDGRPADQEVLATRIELTLLRAAIRDFEGDRAGSDADARWAEAESIRAQRPELRGGAVLQLALNADLAGDPADEVERLAGEARTLLVAAGQHYEIGVLELNMGVSLMVRSRWPRALAAFEAAAEAFNRCGAVLGALMTDVNRGGILVEQGRLDEAFGLFESVVRRARAAEHGRVGHFANGSAARARAWQGDTESAIEALTSFTTALDEAGHSRETTYLRWYRTEALVLAGRFDEARDDAGTLLGELVDLPEDQAVGAALTRLAAIAAHLQGEPGAIEDIRASLALARDLDATYEIVRALQALEALAPETDPAWSEERERLSAELGVIWLPPISFDDG